MNVLIVDDERGIIEGVRGYFEQAGFGVWAAYDGLTGLQLATQRKPDMVVLDLMLPGMDGLDVCREVRKRSDVPIIMLTARSEEADRLIGLELGADDYVCKPFSPRELVARVRTVLRRAGAADSGASSPMPQIPEIFYFGNVTFDAAARFCVVDGETVLLTPTEYSLLYALLRHPDQVLSRLQLLEAANLGVYDGVERTIDVHIHRLRRKLEPDPTHPTYILTAFGAGYRFNGAQMAEPEARGA